MYYYRITGSTESFWRRANYSVYESETTTVCFEGNNTYFMETSIRVNKSKWRGIQLTFIDKISKKQI